MDEMRALIAKWREGKVRAGRNGDMQLHGGRWVATLCADELEQVLAAQPAAQTPASALREALEIMVEALKWYAGKYGLGPAKLQYALAKGEQALAAAPQASPEPPSDSDIFALACKLVDTASADRKTFWLPVLSQLCEAVRKQNGWLTQRAAAAQPDRRKNEM